MQPKRVKPCGKRGEICTSVGFRFYPESHGDTQFQLGVGSGHLVARHTQVPEDPIKENLFVRCLQNGKQVKNDSKLQI